MSSPATVERQESMAAHWKCLVTCCLVAFCPFEYGLDFGCIGGLQAMPGFLQVRLYENGDLCNTHSKQGLWLRGSVYTRWIQHCSCSPTTYLITVDTWNVHQCHSCR